LINIHAKLTNQAEHQRPPVKGLQDQTIALGQLVSGARNAGDCPWRTMLPVNFIKSSVFRPKKALLLGDGTLLVVDEVQKIPNWSESIKALWD
jgi:hypothetical protein